MTVASSRGKVLLADDDDDVLRATTNLLRGAGFFVDTASTGHEAADLLAVGEYDALLADICMPGNEGLELTQRRRDGQAAVPVILMTGYPTLETAVMAVRHGVVEYVTKPVPPRDLMRVLDGAVSRGRALRELARARDRASVLVETVEALEKVVALGGIHPPDPSNGPPSSGRRDPFAGLTPHELGRLSPRERDVVRLLAMGNTLPDIAKALHLSAHTVRNHVKSVFAKLHVRSQVALLGKLSGNMPRKD